ncbi:hypothetical protein COU58_04390 [Candidatus Pacearchaeota archaeon CG10_big_fil_rev_8_21_14_0_10_32_42]|nr:MAG: hypothetical protein COU58_04390 [Candidatus Pacearchaeota archaeon CG10_big_fil_rev_8_21_14_0_10_32_42]
MKRIYSGITLTLIGLVLIIVSLVWKYIILIYGIPTLAIGIYVILNQSEDEIEKVNYNGGKK